MFHLFRLGYILSWCFEALRFYCTLFFNIAYFTVCLAHWSYTMHFVLPHSLTFMIGGVGEVYPTYFVSYVLKKDWKGFLSSKRKKPRGC
jgi:hypothetical protein